METKVFRPYTGDGKYIFISYAHKDSSSVYPIIMEMMSEGYRVWYDEGIDPGTEWDEGIAAHVESCDSFIAFISDSYLASENCKDELNFARDLCKERLLVYLEDVKLPGGMAMRLNRLQAIHKYTYPRETDFFSKLYSTTMLSRSKGEKPAGKETAGVPVSDAKSSVSSMGSAAPFPFSAEGKAPTSSRAGLDMPKISGPYHLEEKIGEGGVATVYKGTHITLQLPVVLKFFRRQAILTAPFLQDAALLNTLKNLNHPNISNILDYHTGEQTYIVQKYIDGFTVYDVLNGNSPIYVDYLFTLELFIQILSALEELHKHNIFYGDLSSRNIMIGYSDKPFPSYRVPYLMDFSECNYNGHEIPDETMMCKDEQSPEKSPGGTIDYRSDIYEAGIILEKMIRKCMHSSSAILVLSSVIDVYSTPIFDIIKKATRLSPGDRYQSAAEMRKALEKAQKEIYALK